MFSSSRVREEGSTQITALHEKLVGRAPNQAINHHCMFRSVRLHQRQMGHGPNRNRPVDADGLLFMEGRARSYRPVATVGRKICIATEIHQSWCKELTEV